MAESKKKRGSADADLDKEIMEERDAFEEEQKEEAEIEAKMKDESEKKQKELLDLLLAQAKKTNNKIPEKDVNKILDTFNLETIHLPDLYDDLWAKGKNI